MPRRTSRYRLIEHDPSAHRLRARTESAGPAALACRRQAQAFPRVGHFLRGAADVVKLPKSLQDVLGDPDAASSDVEIERKYLLSGLPETVHHHPVVEIDQGYLPGERLRERIRKVRHSGGIDYKRTIKLGSGIARFEIDEATTEEVFEAMWPLTAGCRVHKRRWEVPEGELIWEIDGFTDRELYLAEVELPSTDVSPPIPEWLRPFVVREVTDEPAYVNLNLAR